jgi:hypothetical protein
MTLHTAGDLGTFPSLLEGNRRRKGSLDIADGGGERPGKGRATRLLRA